MNVDGRGASRKLDHMVLVGLQGQGSFLARDVSVLKPEEKGGLLSTLVSTQSRLLAAVTFNNVSDDFAVCDSHGQIFHFQMIKSIYLKERKK